jgi:hypothetical protein
MGRPTAKVLRSRDHLTKLWRNSKGQHGEKVPENQDRDCCDAAHQKSHQPNVRDGKVGVSRLPEEDHASHQCDDADSVFEKVLTDFPTISFIWIIHIKLIGPLL